MLGRLYGRAQRNGIPPAGWFAGRSGAYNSAPTARAPWQFPEVLDYWDARYGVTSASERVSAWAPTMRGADSLDQATGANQPILLPYSGTNYLWLSGVNSNYGTTPDASPLDILGDIDMRFYVAMNDWTPSAAGYMITKEAAQASYAFGLNTDGTLFIRWSADGSAVISKSSTVATGVTDFAAKWVRVTLDVDNGAAGNDVKFWTSDDGSTWTQLGTTVTTAGTTSIFNSTSQVGIGAYSSGGNPCTGKLYRAQIYNGIAGTLVFDANFTAVPEGATTFTESSSNAATVTINSTGAKPAQIVGSQQLLFDGAAHYLKTASFTLNQPLTEVLLLSQVTWTNNDTFSDGDTAASVLIKQSTSSPKISLYAGSSVAEADGPALKTMAAIGAVFNGASSWWQLNLGAQVTGNVGANNAGGFTLGAGATPGNYANIQVKAAAICNSALSQARLNQLIRSMAAQATLSV